MERTVLSADDVDDADELAELSHSNFDVTSSRDATMTLTRRNSSSNHVTLKHVTPPPPPPFTCINTLNNTCAQDLRYHNFAPQQQQQQHHTMNVLEHTSAFCEPQIASPPPPHPFDDVTQPPCTCDDMQAYSSQGSRAPSVHSAILTPPTVTPPPSMQTFHRHTNSLARNCVRVKETPI